MARDDVSSTEKLLKLIRQKDSAPAAPEPRKTPPPEAASLKSPPTPLISLKKSSTVGIDIGHVYLRLVRTVEEAGGKLRAVDRRRLKIPPGTGRETPEFSSFLKAALNDFCASARRSKLWAIMSSAHVEISHIRIPRVEKKQIANAVYWTAKRESPFNESEVYFDFEVQGEVIDQGIPKLAVLFYTSPRREVDDLRQLFAGIGWPLTGISLVPFAVQNYFRTGWIPDGEGTLAHLFIGNDFSRIDVYSEGNLVLTRGIKAGNASMVEALLEQYNQERRPEAPPLTKEQAGKILAALSPDSPPLQETDAGFDLAKEKVFGMVQPAIERLVRQAERTFEHYATLPGNKPIDRIFVSTAANIYQPVIDYVGNQLGMTSEVLDPLGERDSIPACRDVEDAHCLSERIAFSPALGMALADNDYTPNLLFTYKDKEWAAGVARFNRAAFAVLIALAIACTAVFTFQSYVAHQKETALEVIETQLTNLGPPIERSQLTAMAAKVSLQRQLFKGYGRQYLGMVLLSELTALTPANIRFLDLKLTLAGAADKEAKAAKDKQAAAKDKIEGVTVEGLIIGDRQTRETSLAGYMRDLNASPVFHQVILQKYSVEPYLKKQEALHFILNMKVEGQVHG